MCSIWLNPFLEKKILIWILKNNKDGIAKISAKNIDTEGLILLTQLDFLSDCSEGKKPLISQTLKQYWKSSSIHENLIRKNPSDDFEFIVSLTAEGLKRAQELEKDYIPLKNDPQENPEQ
jgi:hypothetical protein